MENGNQEALAEVSDEDIAELLAKISCNAHIILDAELEQSGLGMYPLASMLNHSSRCVHCHSMQCCGLTYTHAECVKWTPGHAMCQEMLCAQLFIGPCCVWGS
jgi:hypothetical protein